MTQATDGGGLALTLCTGVFRKVEGEGLQTRNGSCCEQGEEVLRKDLSVDDKAEYNYFINYVDFQSLDSVFLQ